jgi:1,4-alpha-glucan branching enzyme
LTRHRDDDAFASRTRPQGAQHALQGAAVVAGVKTAKIFPERFSKTQIIYIILMKHNKNHDNGPGPGPHLQPVRFEFTDPTAAAVSVAGTFNEWHPTAKAMHHSGNGHWLKETALAPGAYEYCLVVDGKWMTDPAAKESVPNPFGGRNSVLRVVEPATAGHPSAA